MAGIYFDPERLNSHVEQFVVEVATTASPTTMPNVMEAVVAVASVQVLAATEHSSFGKES